MTIQQKLDVLVNLAPEAEFVAFCQQELAAEIFKNSIERVKEIVNACFNDAYDGSDVVLQPALAALMNLVPEAEFVDFCEALS